MKCQPFLLIFILFTLAACEAPEDVIEVTRPVVVTEEVVVTETAVPTQPPATPEPTQQTASTIAATESSPATDLELIEGIEKQPISPDTVTAAEPTPTPQLLPIPESGWGELPAIPVSQESYRLKTPDETLLLHLLVTLSVKAKQQITAMHDFEKVIMADISHHYNSELPNAYLLLEDDELNFTEQVGEPLQSSWEAMQTSVIQHLNRHGLYTSDSLQFTQYPLDLDADGQEDILLQFSAIGHSISGLMPLRRLADNSFEMIANDFPPESTNILWENTALLDHDLTGDGQPEVIWHTQSYWGRAYFEEIRVFNWNGQKLELLTTIDLSRSAGTFVPQFMISDFNNDGIDDIEVVEEGRGNFECSMQVFALYRWSEDTLVLEPRVQVSTPACYIWSTVHRSNMEEVAVELQQALVDWEATDPMNASLIALARIHLAMAQTAVGQPDAAQATLDELYNLPGDVQFVQLAQQAYEAAGKRPLPTCRNLLANTDALLQTDIGLYLSFEGADPEYVAFGGMDGTLPHRQTICNLNNVVRYLIRDLSLPAAASPVDLLVEQGIHYDFATSYNLDDDPELEWVGILESQWPDLLIFDAVDGIWQPQLKPLLLTELTDFTTAARDVTGDGQTDIFGLLTGSHICFGDTTRVTNYQKIEMLAASDNALRYSGESFSCLRDEHISIEDVGSDHFTSSPQPVTPEWQLLDNFPATDQSLYSYSQELQTAVLTQSDPDIATKITDLLTYLPNDDPGTQPYIEHLTYLLGYHYELSWDAATAVTTYLSLIQQAPTSPWSWLAWARLEPIMSEP